MASVMNFRVDDELRDRFTQAVEARSQTPSEAMREALILYIKRVRNEQLLEASARIAGSSEDEEDVMRWADEHGSGADD